MRDDNYRFMMLCLVTFALAGCSGDRPSNPTSATDIATVQDERGSATAQASDSVTICHIPAGDLALAHNITVAGSALPAHLAHGDLILPCPQP
ncbi:MAG: hypothetical protein DMF77_02275 [Acidobacteria bacterium]|nr:MAG: hypothetical protein DMF77_02275 [Acidobacteriota bacterium]